MCEGVCMFEFVESLPDLSVVPQQFQSLYQQSEGGFKLISDGPAKGAVEAIVGLSKALKASRADVEQAKKSKVDLSPLKEFGEDPATIHGNITKKMKELQDQLAQGDKGKLDLENLRKDMQASAEKSRNEYENRIKGLTGQLHTLLRDNVAKSAIAAHKGDELLLKFVQDFTTVEEADGQLNVLVVDDKGNKRFGGTGNPMTIAELVAEMKGNKTYAKFFESETPKGGGSPPGGQNRGAARPPVGNGTRDEMTSSQKIALGLSKGQHRRGEAASR